MRALLAVREGAPTMMRDERALADAYRACRRIARTHYENFTIGSLLMPRRLRADLAAVYAFARGADDLADEGDLIPATRLAALDAWERRLVACAADEAPPGDPVFLALGHTIVRHRLPLAPFRALLEAFRRDARGDSAAFATFDDLLGYCRLSANPVGRIVLGLFGVADDAAAERADDICTALQLTNFWQDVGGDLARGRVYLPAEDLDAFPGSRDALARRQANLAFRDLLAFEVRRTRALFERGLPLARMVGGRLGVEIRLFAAGGLAILDRLDAAAWDVFTCRPTLARSDLLVVGLRSLRS
jgi:squalene synthase HpnC